MARRLWLWTGAGAGVAALGAIGWALGPGAPMVVTWLADGRNVGRLGVLDLEGVAGPHIGALRAARVTITDSEGVWIDVRDVALDWSPAAVFANRIDVNSVNVADIAIARQPVLAPPKPPGWFRPDVRIGALRATRIRLGAPLLGRAAELSAEGALTTDDGAIVSASLDAVRLDAQTDSLRLRYRTGDDYLRVDARSEPQGVLAAALGAPNESVRIAANARGSESVGEGSMSAQIGDRQFAAGNGAWTSARWQGAGRIELAAAPILAPLTERFGPTLALRGEGERGNARDQPFEAHLQSENLDAHIQGRRDQNFRLRGEAALTATTNDLDRLVPEMRVGAGAARIEGRVRTSDDRLRFEGDGAVDDVAFIGLTANARGPVSLSWGATRIETEGEFALTGTGAPLNRRLLQDGALSARVVVDLRRNRVDIARAALQSSALHVSTTGRFEHGSGAIEGDWRVMDFAAASPTIAGAAQGRWRVARENGGAVRLEARGAAREFTARDRALAQLVGATPRLEATGAFETGGLRLDRARLDGANLRMGAQGLVGPALDMRLEAAARGPISLGAAEINGAVDAQGRLSGPIASPRLAVDAYAQRFDAGGVTVAAPAITFTYDGRAARGDVTARGTVSGAAAQAQARIQSTRGAMRFEELTFEAAGFSGAGSAALTDNGPALDLTFSGILSGLVEDASGAIEGDVDLVPTRGASPRLALNARLRNAGYGDIRAVRGDLSLEGPLDRLAARATLRGYADDAPIAFDGDGAITSRAGAVEASLNWRSTIGEERFATRAPARVLFANGRTEASVALFAGDGEADFTYRADRRGSAATARFDRAELSVVSVLFGARLEGVMSGQARLESIGENLRGDADLAIDNARLPARMRAPLDVAINARLEPNRITGSMRARSTDGLDASIEGSAPVTTRARPLRIALTENGEGEARWQARGPADSLWALVGGLDQSLSGQMQGEGAIRFNAQSLRGEGHLTLADGRFEDKRAGLTFTDVGARFAFTEEGESQFQLSARDESGGRLSGLGAAQGLRSGRMALRLDDLRFVERPDVTATASGDVILAWAPDGATLSGALTLNQAELTLAQRADAIIPSIDVVEINRPDGERNQRPRPRGAVARLDLSISAPGRVYTRGRGLNAEWSLDAHLRGTSAAPLLQGDARLVRGDFDLAGRPFEMTRGRIGFVGALDDTTIDLLAERSVPELTARAAITGRLFDPTITFSSDPALPEDEIMPQILFGRSAEDLSPLQAAQLAASLAALAGGAAFDIAGMARAAVGLDRFDVREDEEGVIVSGGRYLTRDVYFEVSRTGLGEPGAKVEWRARPQLSIVTSFQSNEDQRVSVRWRRDY